MYMTAHFPGLLHALRYHMILKKTQNMYLYHNYTLYKNAVFWLVNSRDIFLQIQALHCEFA